MYGSIYGECVCVCARLFLSLYLCVWVSFLSCTERARTSKRAVFNMCLWIAILQHRIATKPKLKILKVKVMNRARALTHAHPLVWVCVCYLFCIFGFLFSRLLLFIYIFFHLVFSERFFFCCCVFLQSNSVFFYCASYISYQRIVRSGELVVVVVVVSRLALWSRCTNEFCRDMTFFF